MKKTLIFIVIFVSVLGTNLKAQKKENLKHYFGTAAGFSTGYGLSYRFLPKNFGFQITYYSSYHPKSYFNLSAGISLFQMLKKSSKSSFYLYEASTYYLMQYLKSRNSPTGEIIQPYNYSNFRTGLGFGIELIFFKRISLNIMSGYSIYSGKKSFNPINLVFYHGITAEIGLFYKL